MSDAFPITPAPVPPSTAGIAQPVIVEGGQSLPPSLPEGTEFTSPGWGWLPLPQVGMGENAPFPTLVVEPAAVPPSVAGYAQPQFATGSGLAPTAASLFPAFTAAGPSPPIVFANIFNMGAVPPPSTPGTQPITISTVATIPQLPWAPASTRSMNENENDELDLEAEFEPQRVSPKPKRSHHATKRRARH